MNATQTRGGRARAAATLAALLLVLSAAPAAHAGLGTFVLDFDGFSDTFLADDITMTQDVETGGFNLGMFNIDDTAENRDAVMMKVLDELNMIFMGKMVSFTKTAPMTGDFSTIGVGPFVDGPAGALGFSETIDFLNKKTDDNGVVFTDLVGKEAGMGADTVDEVARALGNTIGHEVAHLLGLTHTDAVAGGNNDAFVNHPTNSLTKKNTIDAFSMFKLDLANDGEMPTTYFGVGNDIASAEDLSMDLMDDELALAKSFMVDDSDIDVYKLTLKTKSCLTIEGYSERLRFDPARLGTDFADIQLMLLDMMGDMVPLPGGSLFTTDGPVGPDLIFNTMLDAGMYFLKVTMGNVNFDNNNGDPTAGGAYELLITTSKRVVPEPASWMLAMIAAGFWGARRRGAP